MFRKYSMDPVEIRRQIYGTKSQDLISDQPMKIWNTYSRVVIIYSKHVLTRTD